MPRKAVELSAIAVKNIKTQGLHSVGGVQGLKLQVKSASSRSWVLRTTIAKKVRDIGLGSYPEISLKSARQLAKDMREQIANGKDPVETRKQASLALIKARNHSKTFDDCATEYIARIESQWTNKKSKSQWQNTIRDYASPYIGKMPISEVTTQDILRILTPIWDSKTETATRIRSRIERVIAYATTHGFRTGDNPAKYKGHLDTILPPPQKLKNLTHHPALPYCQTGQFVRQLRKLETISALALEFTILTAARSGDTRGATWQEINIKSATWTIPACRMKGKKEHIIPLSSRCLKILNQLHSPNGKELVFKGQAGMLSDMSLGKTIKRLHAKESQHSTGFIDPHSNRIATTHGFRSSFRDWAAEQTTFPREVIEHCLAHKLKDRAEAAYQRSTILNKRTTLMEDWCRYLK